MSHNRKLQDYKNRFFSIKLIDSGSSGEIYAVKDKRNNKFALKKISKDKLSIDNFIKEIDSQKLASKNGDNVLKISGVFEDDNNYYISMPLMITDLYYLEKKDLSEDRIRTLLRDIALGLLQIKQAGLIHNDIKLENILLNKKGKALICDFGYCRFHSCFERGGTIYNSSPEKLEGLLDVKTDIWSYGVLIYDIHQKDVIRNDLTEPSHIMYEIINLDVNSLPTLDDPLINDLCKRIFVESKNRITIEEILNHDYFKKCHNDQLL